MNEQEARSFSEELLIAFPAFKAVSERHSPNFARTREGWGLAWRDLSIGECRDVLRQLLLTGDIGYEDFQQPGPFIRRLVLAARPSKLSEAESVGSTMERYRKRWDYTGSPMASALAKAMDATRAGASSEEIDRLITEALGPTKPEYDQPRYRCSICQDRGLVRVFRMDTAVAVHRLVLPIEKVTSAHTYLVACKCSEGDSKNQRTKPLPVYDENQFCLFRDESMVDERARLQEWMLTREVKRPANYDPSFERYAS